MNTDGLRTFVEAVDREMSRLPGAGAAQGPPLEALKASWARLVGFLALGPAPKLRDCPRCGRSGMRDAKLCGYCWAQLPPLDVKQEMRT
jgi:hypothetical protein